MLQMLCNIVDVVSHFTKSLDSDISTSILQDDTEVQLMTALRLRVPYGTRNVRPFQSTL